MFLYGPAPNPRAWPNPWTIEDLKKTIGEKNSQGINRISVVLPTCDLIFYFPLHVQGLHIDSAVANKSCACNPSVWLTESIFFIFISKNRV